LEEGLTRFAAWSTTQRKMYWWILNIWVKLYIYYIGK
jgi:hypothetical protein